MAGDAKTAMDAMYRRQRHIYNLTRKFYLFGRDTMMKHLNIHPGETVCEVGCGTARNLILLARLYPQANFCGIDASTEMLTTARESIAAAGLSDRIKVEVALAQDFNGQELFKLKKPFDRLLFSYSLSMIDEWRAAIDHGLTQLKPDGSVHIVDFGDQEGLPGWFKGLLGSWLAAFHVRFRPEIKRDFEERAATGAGALSFRNFMRGYAYLLTFERSAQNPS
jgi:S-adenosylmethionine-diacylgycerolhomoserine-N-methlytransferase